MMHYYFRHSLFAWAIKDSASRYVYANPLACRIFNISEKALAGCLDTDLTPDIGEYYRCILHDDKRILATNKMSIAIKNIPIRRTKRSQVIYG